MVTTEPLDLTKLKGNARPFGYLTDLRTVLYAELMRPNLTQDQRVALFGMLTELTLESKKKVRKRYQAAKKSATGKRRGRPPKMLKIIAQCKAEEYAKRHPEPTTKEAEDANLKKFLQDIDNATEPETIAEPAS
jgi:hypothetical protein